MTSTSIPTTVGFNDIGFFIGEDDVRIQLTKDQMNALNFANTYAESIGDVFANYCAMTLTSGEIPSCFRQDMSEEEILFIRDSLSKFKEHFSDALFNLLTVSHL